MFKKTSVDYPHFVKVEIIGELSNRKSKGELNALLFAIEDYINIKNLRGK